MLRIAALALLIFFAATVAPLRAEEALEFPEPQACPAVEGLILAPGDEAAWPACDKWAWSCISRGLEANFFAKECVELRTPRARELRTRYKFAPFADPDKYAIVNGVSKNFLPAILSRKEYANEIPATGIRLVGAYFANTVNLENVTTDRNLVLDQSIFKDGMRLTNFRGDRNLSLDGSNVRGKIFLLRANIGGTLFLEEGVYDLLDAGDARFGGSIDGPGSVFNAPIRLDRVKVDGKVSLIRSRLTEFTAFDTTIGSKLEMRYAHVRGRIDLTGTTINGDLRLQRLKFGRKVEGHPKLTCDWDLTDPAQADPKRRFFLAPNRPDFAGRETDYARILEEAVFSRPEGVIAGHPCVRTEDASAEEGTQVSRGTQHEVLLRDMRIGGALCMVDLTGEIENGQKRGDDKTEGISLISLDGTEARTAIVRWTESQSDTRWQAVHFKANNLFIDLDTKPNRFFFDNFEIGNVSFLKRDRGGREQVEPVEDWRNFLCEVPSGEDAQYKSDDPETHSRIVAFFDSPANASSNAQPFAEIVRRLDHSGAASTKLKVAFSDFKYRKLCQSSNFFSKLEAERASGLADMPGKMFAVARTLIAQSPSSPLDEARRIGLDIACRPMLAAYRFSVSYGYEPLNILYIIVFFVLMFWGLLQFDEPMPGGFDGRPTRLGLLYAIDMFNPFSQIRINRQHASWTPRTAWLQVYLRFHRFVGFVLCLLLALGIYSAGIGVNP